METKVEIGPNSLSHDYLCPMTIWCLIKRSHCLHDWSKKKKKKGRWRSSLSAGQRLLLFTSLSAEFILLSPVRSTKLQNVGFFFKEWLTLTITGKEPGSGCADSCTPLSRIVWGCQSRTPPPHRHTHTQTNRHRTHTHFMPVPIARGYNSRKNIKSSRCVQFSDTDTIISSSGIKNFTVDLLTCAVIRYNPLNY